MHGDTRVILHIVFDNILFDAVYQRFEIMENYENRYLLSNLRGSDNTKFDYIKNSEKVMRVETIEEWGSIVSDKQVDIVFLHGLWDNYLKAVDYIGANVIVMWWCYGQELYENTFKWTPLLPLRVYKPKTHLFCIKNAVKGFHYLNAEFSYSFPGLYRALIRVYYLFIGRKSDALKRMLSRIDYAFTPLDMELVELKKRHPYIKAKPYKLRAFKGIEPLTIHQSKGGILLEHSANITNNHLDIIAAIKKKKIDLDKRKVYIPLSYGNKDLAELVRRKAVFAGADVHCLMETLPFNDYKEMISSCTHAFFGMIRQSGLGNVYLCFRKGIKVFFFKDSILYKHFKDHGFYVYSIEDDLSDDSISEPLTPAQAKTNYDKFYSLIENVTDGYEQQFDNILNNKTDD